MDKTPSPQEQLEHLRAIVKAVDICMLTTVHADGSLHTRPMSNNSDVEFDGDLWFFTNADAHVLRDIEANPQVSCGFADIKGQNYAALSGAASIVRDQAKIEELWKPVLKAWFPDGPAGGDIALIKVHAERGEFWDGQGGFIAQAISLAAALLTGKQMDYGESGKVDL
jgi:general stress protein 26